MKLKITAFVLSVLFINVIATSSYANFSSLRCGKSAWEAQLFTANVRGQVLELSLSEGGYPQFLQTLMNRQSPHYPAHIVRAAYQCAEIRVSLPLSVCEFNPSFPEIFSCESNSSGESQALVLDVKAKSHCHDRHAKWDHYQYRVDSFSFATQHVDPAQRGEPRLTYSLKAKVNGDAFVHQLEKDSHGFILQKWEGDGATHSSACSVDNVEILR